MSRPGVSSSINSWERHTAVHDLEVGLVLQHQGTLDTRWNFLWEANKGERRDIATTFEWCREGCSEDCESGELLEHDGWSTCEEMR